MRKKTSWLNEAFTWSLKHDGESKGEENLMESEINSAYKSAFLLGLQKKEAKAKAFILFSVGSY